MADDRPLDKVYADYQRELPSGTENLAQATTIAFQYQVAKAQEKWARVSTLIAGASVVVGIAAVVVAALG